MFLINDLVNLIAWALGSVVRLVFFGFWIWAIYDCATRRFREPNHKWLWLAGIVIFYDLGAMAYLIFGRERGYRY